MRDPTQKVIDTSLTPVNSQLTPFNTHSTDYQNVKLPMPREFNGKKYYGAADVAKIIGVDKTTVWHWQNDLYFDCPLFTADERAHDGRYLYEVERVMQLASVYHPKWTHGGYGVVHAEKPASKAPLEGVIELKKISKATIAAINRLSPDELERRGVLQPARSGHICPYCRNGTGHDGTGVTQIKDTDLYHCFKCGKTFNNLQIFKLHYGIENFAELVEKICVDFEISLEHVDFDAPKGKRKKNYRQRDEKPLDELELNFIRKDLETSAEPLEKLLDAQKIWRGLPLETLLKFNCRLIWQWTPPQSRTKPYTPTARMIVPCSDEAYLARMMLPPNKEFIKPHLVEFFKGKEKMHAGHKRLFNPDALTRGEPVFVVEGYIDAMSIDYAGYPSVALGAAARGDLLVDAVANMKNKPQIIILLDSDATGREQAPKLLEELIGDCCPAVVRYLDDGDSKIDCNEILQTQGVDNLRGRLADIIDDSISELAALKDDFAAKKDKRNNDSDLNSLFNGNDSDLTFARRLEKFCGSNVRWLTDDEKWLMYQDGVWKRGSENNSCVSHLGRSLADTLTQYATTNTEKNLAEKFQSSKKISAAITLLKTCDSIRITADDLDRHLNLLNCLNGVVDLQTGWLYPNVEMRSAMITQQCRAAIDKDAKSETVDNFFRDIMPDEMTRAGLLRWLGYCLTGEVSEEKFAVWIGASGANGKGTLSGTLLELLGSYATGLAPRALLRKYDTDADKATTALNVLENARFAISEEMPLDGELDCSLTKNLTGGDRINLRKNYGEYRTIRSTAKINLSGNFAPRIENVHDGGILRRMINFAFQVQFGTREHPADNNLKKKLLRPDNLSALLFLLVRESKAWYRGDEGGLVVSPLMKQATERHLSQNDFVADFIDDNYELNPKHEIKAKDLIDALKREYPRECSRFKRNDLIQLVANVDGVTYELDRHKTRIFKGIGKAGAPQQQSLDDFDGEPIAPDDLPL